MRLSQMIGVGADNRSVESKYRGYQLLVQGGYIYKVSPGIYSHLPLMVRVLQNISKIIQDKMNSLGFQECLLLQEETQSRNRIGFAHEQIISSIREELIPEGQLNSSSVCLYHLATKANEEIEAFGGLLQSREFIMLDCYSFHKSRESLSALFQAIVERFSIILREIGITFSIFELPQEEAPNSICYSFKARVSTEEEFEIGRAYQLDKEPSSQRGAGGRQPFIGFYTLGVSLLSQVAVEQNYDQNGIVWSARVAPYEAVLLTDCSVLNIERAERLYTTLNSLGIPTLLDDRDESIELKIKYAKLIGIPFLILGEEISNADVLFLRLIHRQGLMDISINADALPQQIKIFFENTLVL